MILSSMSKIILMIIEENTSNMLTHFAPYSENIQFHSHFSSNHSVSKTISDKTHGIYFINMSINGCVSVI